MGQYYRAVTGLQGDGSLTGVYELDGCKLMEFAYADDSSLAFLLDMLEGRPQHLVFMGDYGDDMPSANEQVDSDVLMGIYREAWARDDEGRSLRNMLAVRELGDEMGRRWRRFRNPGRFAHRHYPHLGLRLEPRRTRTREAVEVS